MKKNALSLVLLEALLRASVKKDSAGEYFLDLNSFTPSGAEAPALNGQNPQDIATLLKACLDSDNKLRVRAQAAGGGQFVGGEILGAEVLTGYTFGGKPIYRAAFNVTGFVQASGFTHNLDIENYININIFASVPSSGEFNKLDGGGGTEFYYGDLQADGIDEIIIDAGETHTTLDIIIEYTKN